jgi:hypothetical protein
LVNPPSIPSLFFVARSRAGRSSIDFLQQQSRSRRRVRLADENRTVQEAGDSRWKHHPEGRQVLSAGHGHGSLGFEQALVRPLAWSSACQLSLVTRRPMPKS